MGDDGVEQVSETEIHYKDLEKGYNAAVTQALEIQNQPDKYVRVTLASDWAADDNRYFTTSFGSGEGFSSGRIFVPYGANIVLDLSGKVVDRNLAAYYGTNPNGSVLYVEGSLIIEDDNPTATHNNMIGFSYDPAEDSTATCEETVNGGVITGGYATKGAGINVSDYGSLTLCAGNVFGNYSKGNGGGISLGDYSSFVMDGGKVWRNAAESGRGNGGGISADYCRVIINGGEISYNYADNNGGGIYSSANGSNEVYDENPENPCVFFIKGGEISHNVSYNEGSGIYYSNSSCTIVGGSVTNNEGYDYYTRAVYGSGDLYVGGNARIYNNHYVEIDFEYDEDDNKVSVRHKFDSNIGLATGYDLRVTGSFENGAKFAISDPEIKVRNYDNYGYSYGPSGTDEYGNPVAPRNIDSKTGHPIDPTEFFQYDEYDGETYLITRVQEGAGTNYSSGYSGTLRATKSHVNWYLYEITVNENGEDVYDSQVAGPFTDKMVISWLVTDYNSQNNYRVGIMAQVNTDYGTSGLIPAEISYFGQGNSFNYAPSAFESNSIATEHPYAAQITVDGEDLWVCLDISATSIADAEVNATIHEGAQYYQLNDDLDGQKELTAENFGIDVKLNGESLTQGTDYTVSLPNTKPHVHENFYVEIKGINTYCGTARSQALKLKTNTEIELVFDYWNIKDYSTKKPDDTENSETVQNSEAEPCKITYDFHFESSNMVAQNFAKELFANCHYELSDGTKIYEIEGDINYNAASENGIAFVISKKIDGKWTKVNEITSVGEYMIKLDKENSTRPDVQITDLAIDPFYLTVTPYKLDSKLFGVIEGDAAGPGATLNDALTIYYNSDFYGDNRPARILETNDAYISGGVTKVLTENGDVVYVYYNGKKMNVKVSDDLQIGDTYTDTSNSKPEERNGGLLIKDIGKITVTHSIGDETGIAGVSGFVTEITTKVKIVFENFEVPQKRVVEKTNEDGTVEYVTEDVILNYLETEFKWAIVTACNNVVGNNGEEYKPTDSADGQIEYGVSINAPKAHYGDGVVMQITKKEDDGTTTIDETFVVVNARGAVTLYNYSATAEGNLGAQIDASFADYVADIIRKGGKGDYTLYAQTAKYTDSVLEVTYESAKQEYKFGVKELNIEGANATVEINVIGDYVYTGSAITPQIRVFINNDSCVKDQDYTVDYSDNVNAGTCTITITGRGVYSGTATQTFTIEKVANAWQTLSMSIWNSGDYNRDVNVIVSYAPYGLSDATYKIEKYVDDENVAPVADLSEFTVSNGKINASAAMTSALNGLLGKYRLTATIAETNNYAGDETYFDFEIRTLQSTYAVPSLTILDTGAGKNDVYNGHELSISIQNFNPSGMSVELTEKEGFSRVGSVLYATNAGTYTATITLNGNNVWSDGSTDAKTLVWTIGKRQVAAPTYGNSSLTYNGQSQTYLPVGYDDAIMEIFGNVGTNVDRYTAVVSLKDVDNYEWSNTHDTNTRLYEFDIIKATNTYTTLSIPVWYYYDYNPIVNRIVFDAKFGLDQATYAIVARANGIWLAIDYLESFKINADGQIIDDKDGAITNALNKLRGTYRIIAEIEGNGNYNGITAYSDEFDIIILPTKHETPSLTHLTTGIGKNDVYTGSALSIGIQNFNPAGMKIELSEGLTLEGNVLYATNAGTYTATITLLDEDSVWSDGYEGASRTYTWTIHKIKVAVPDFATTKFMYNGKEQTFLPNGFDPTLMEISDNTGTDAKTYTAKLSLKDPVNYEWDNPNYGVEIPYQFEIESATRIFVIIISVLSAIALVVALVALAQWLMHKQRLKVFAMANDDDEVDDEDEVTDDEDLGKGGNE